MSDKIVNHFVLADGSTAKYDAGALLNLDDTVSLAGYAPDAKAVGDRLTDVENLAETLNEGGLELKDDVIATNVEDWLDDHPEATTTVQDGAITKAKINTAFLHEIENAYVTPEMFGAGGDGVVDDSTAISNCMAYAYNNRVNVKFKRTSYKVRGNNPCGLPRIVPTDTLQTQERNMIVDFNDAHIYYYPTNEDDMFSFVGYARKSIYKNLWLTVTPPSNASNYGDVFSTFFGINNVMHEFSGNIFSNITVSGNYRRVFSFECKNTEQQTHDDLSIFEKIHAGGYKSFYYTDNSNSVSNTFTDCSTTNNVDGSKVVDINTSSWGSGLRLLNHHFTVMDCDGAVLFNINSVNTPYATVYVDKPRMEVRKTATNWQYFNMRGGVLYLNDLFTTNYPIYSANNTYGVLYPEASVEFNNSPGIYTPFKLIGGALNIGSDSPYESLIFKHCSFVNGDTTRNRTAYPLIQYSDNNGNIISSRATALNTYVYGNIRIEDNTSRFGNYSQDRWLSSYTIYNNRCTAGDTSDKKRTLYKRQASGNGACCDYTFIIPHDIVCRSVVYTQTGSNYELQNQINNMRVEFPNGERASIRTDITASTINVELIAGTLYLKAGTAIRVNMYLNDTKKTESVFTRNTVLNMEYTLPATPDDYTNCENVSYIE